jgi:hypothetical protein
MRDEKAGKNLTTEDTENTEGEDRDGIGRHRGTAPGLPKQMGELNYAAPARLPCIIENYG